MGVIEGGGRIPYTPEARALKEENQANWVDRDPEIKCYMPGVPRATYMPFPFQIFQNENNIFIAYEFAGAVRDIYLEDVGPAETDSWMGQSVGRWEGDTLVVEVTGQNDQTWFDRAGSHHTNQLRVVERYTLIGPNHIQYEATMEDPNVFTEPWTIRMPLVPPDRAGGAADGLQVRRVRRGAAVWRSAPDPAAALGAREARNGAGTDDVGAESPHRRPGRWSRRRCARWSATDIRTESREVWMRNSIRHEMTAGAALALALVLAAGATAEAQEIPRTANGRPRPVGNVRHGDADAAGTARRAR